MTFGRNIQSTLFSSESCSILVHILAAIEDRLLSTVFLLNLLILDHHHFI